MCLTDIASAGDAAAMVEHKVAAVPKPVSPQHGLLEHISHLPVHYTSHDVKSLNIFHHFCRKLPARGTVLVFIALALYILFVYIPAFNVADILPCRKTSSCSLAKLVQRVTAQNASKPVIASEQDVSDLPTDLRHIVFCIASTARSWRERQEYVKLWWQPPQGGTQRRGFVWLDKPPLVSAANSSRNTTVLPDVRISGNTDNFAYTWKGGTASAVRISRMASETFRLGLEDVRWFVMGDDDTIFFPENLAMVLQQYDHRRFYYIGQASESQKQSVRHSSGMAFGGAGIAISYALMEVVEKMQDSCLARYPNVYGSDSRIEACIAELGVPLTTVKGFHQIDLRGDISGLLAAHPVAPLVSLHHIDSIEPIFPDKSRLEALRHLIDGAVPDMAGTLQQSICYDITRNITLSVSWGYVVQVFGEILTPLEVQKPALTFVEWRSRQGDPKLLKFDVRSLPADPCKRPVVFFMKNVTANGDTETSLGVYERKRLWEPQKCGRFVEHDFVEVHKQRQNDTWFTAPQRQYCEVVTQNPVPLRPHSLTLQVRNFKQNDVIAPH